MGFRVAWLWRGLFLAGVVVCLAVGIALAWAASWKEDALVRLEEGGAILDTAAGPQQIAEEGEGSPVLVIHGAPGGYDQGLAIAEGLGLEGFHVAAPSRPGYLGTPLATGPLLEQQADALASLLDALNIPSAAVLGFGAGAPVAIHLAARHPDRVTALVLVSGVFERLPPAAPDRPAPLPERILRLLAGDVTSAFVAWQLREVPARILPLPDVLREALALSYAGPPEGAARLIADVEASPAQTAELKEFLGTLVPISARESGLRNDIFQLMRLPALPAREIACPVLMLHGAADPLQSQQTARAFCAKIPGAIFLGVEGTGHLPWLGPDAERARQALRRFLSAPDS